MPLSYIVAVSAALLGAGAVSQEASVVLMQVGRSLVLPVAVTDDPSAGPAQFTVYQG